MGPTSDIPPPQSRFLKRGAVVADRYEIIVPIDKGGTGEVYEVKDQRTARTLALKLMRQDMTVDASLRERFLQEATVATNIDSDHVVMTTDAGEDSQTNRPFIVMELLEGETLAQRIERRGRLPASEVVTLMSQAARAIDRAHAAGVIHRDLKPANLFVTRRHDGSLCLKILDFGMAKLLGGASEETASLVGTPLYMAPEQLNSSVSPRSDLYALAQVAFEALVGAHYWNELRLRGASFFEVVDVLRRGCQEAASVRARRSGAELPQPFDDWFARATAADPQDRYESAASLVEGLRDALTAADSLLPEESAEHTSEGDEETARVGAPAREEAEPAPRSDSAARETPQAPHAGRGPAKPTARGFSRRTLVTLFAGGFVALTALWAAQQLMGLFREPFAEVKPLVSAVPTADSSEPQPSVHEEVYDAGKVEASKESETMADPADAGLNTAAIRPAPPAPLASRPAPAAETSALPPAIWSDRDAGAEKPTPAVWGDGDAKAAEKAPPSASPTPRPPSE